MVLTLASQERGEGCTLAIGNIDFIAATIPPLIHARLHAEHTRGTVSVLIDNKTSEAVRELRELKHGHAIACNCKMHHL